MFCVVVIVGNIIFQKFIHISIPSILDLEVSVGVLLYPITFLISDLLTEFYGKKRAKYVIQITIIISFLVMCLLYISVNLKAVDWSAINDEQFEKIFSVYNAGTLASIIAMYIGQIIDITVFSWLKTKTNGKHLWLRNNVSTIIAQFFDTVTVLSILCFFNILPLSQLSNIFISSFIFKIIAAIIDTPFCYLGHFIVNSIIKDHRK
jgi:uncharacterized integral membrane protein (TIGR00697 family)